MRQAVVCLALGVLACRPPTPRGPVGGAAAGGALAAGSGAPCAGALLCDDFERYPEGAPPGGRWTSQTTSGAVAVARPPAGAPPRRGTKAVKFTTTGATTYQSAFIRLGPGVLPVAGNAFYGRMMFRLEAAPTTPVHWTMLQGSGLVPGQRYHAQYRYGGQHPIAAGSQLMANYETPDSYQGLGPATDCWFHSDGKVVPVATWSCVEWQLDGATNTMRLWLDGAPIDSLTVTGVGQGCVNQRPETPWTAPVFDRLELGWESYQADEPRTFWIDDVVVSTTRIGCPPE